MEMALLEMHWIDDGDGDGRGNRLGMENDVRMGEDRLRSQMVVGLETLEMEVQEGLHGVDMRMVRVIGGDDDGVVVGGGGEDGNDVEEGWALALYHFAPNLQHDPK